MRKIVYIIGLTTLIVSCAAKKPVKKSSYQPKTTVNKNTSKPVESIKTALVKHDGVEFYKQNIGDVSKNDNTISYGSIVSAEPRGYKVVKTYFPAVAQNFRQKYLILHYTALDHDKSVMVLTQQAVSSHYLVNDLGDKEIYQLVDENKRAYHAGVSVWRKDKNLNDNSIGIEIVNTGYTTDGTGKKIFAPFNADQVKKVASLVSDIVNRYNIPATNVLGHSDIAPTRKQDPGPEFPWKKLYTDYNIGMWYDNDTKQSLLTEMNDVDFLVQQNTFAFIFKIQSDLQKFGYDINPSGVWDKENSKVVEAFQYHFRPENYDGIVDKETWAILQALLQKYAPK